MAAHALALRMAKELRLEDPSVYEDMNWQDGMQLVEP